VTIHRLEVAASVIAGSRCQGASASKHEVVGASRNDEVKVNLEDSAAIHAMFNKIPGVAAVISCAGSAAFRSFVDLTDADYELGLRSKLMGQVTLRGGSITLTTAIPGSASISMVKAGLEGFVRAAALEMPRTLRINAMSPPRVKETMVKLGMDPTSGLASAEVAKA
jgi:NAD(P)-dependent dehydrogenase (short-subunit alcohol dehydrogenase family)